MTSTAQAAMAANAERLAAATAAGSPFHLGVTLSCVGGHNDKFWTAVWADTAIVVHYGAHNTAGQYAQHAFATREQAAARMWSLLREKVGVKNYAVSDAAVMIVPEDMTSSLATSWSADRQIVYLWEQLRQARAVNPKRIPRTEDNPGRSPRTGKQGGQVLAALTRPEATAEELLAAWECVPSERFLNPIVLSHPACPEEARFLTALMGIRVV